MANARMVFLVSRMLCAPGDGSSGITPTGQRVKLPWQAPAVHRFTPYSPDLLRTFTIVSC